MALTISWVAGELSLSPGQVDDLISSGALAAITTRAGPRVRRAALDDYRRRLAEEQKAADQARRQQLLHGARAAVSDGLPSVARFLLQVSEARRTRGIGRPASDAGAKVDGPATGSDPAGSVGVSVAE